MNTQDTSPYPSESPETDVPTPAPAAHEIVEQQAVPISWDRKLYVLFVTTLTVIAMYHLGPLGLIVSLTLGLMSFWGEPLDTVSRKKYRGEYKLVISIVTLILVSVYGFWFLPLLLLLGGQKLLAWIFRIKKPIGKLILIILAYWPFPVIFCKGLARWRKEETADCPSEKDARAKLRQEAARSLKAIPEAILSILPENTDELGPVGRALSYSIVIGVMLPAEIFFLHNHWATIISFYDVLSPAITGALASIGGTVTAIGEWRFLSVLGEAWDFLWLVGATILGFLGLIFMDFAINSTLHLLILIGVERLYNKSEPFRNWWHRTFDSVKEFFLTHKNHVVNFFQKQPRLVRAALFTMFGPLILLVFMFVWLSTAVRLFILKKVTIALLKKPVLKARKLPVVRKSVSWVGQQAKEQGKKAIARIKRGRQEPAEQTKETSTSA